MAQCQAWSTPEPVVVQSDWLGLHHTLIPARTQSTLTVPSMYPRNRGHPITREGEREAE